MSDDNTLLDMLNRYINKGDDENCDLWSRVLNYSLIAQMLKIVGADSYNQIKTLAVDSTVNQKIIDMSYEDMERYIITKLTYLKQQIQANRSSPTSDLVDTRIFTPTDLLDDKNLLTFHTIVGLEDAKEELRNSIIKPILYPTLYGNISRGILLYGLPGVGKTELVKAAMLQLQYESCQSNSSPVVIKLFTPTGGDLKGKYVGQSEKQIKALFQFASEEACKGNKDKYIFEDSDKEPRTISIIFLDEIEAIAGSRDNDESGIMTTTVNTLLQMMGGIKSYDNVVVIAATNYPDKLDSAILRRFDRTIYIRAPNASEIEQIIHYKLSNLIKRTLKDSQQPVNALKEFCEQTETVTERRGFCTFVDTQYRSAQLQSNLWKRYGDYMALSEKRLSSLTAFLARNNYTASDINNIFTQLKRQMAMAAESKNTFVSTSVPDSEGKPIPVVISTLGRKDLDSTSVMYMNKNVSDIYGDKLSSGFNIKWKNAIDSNKEMVQTFTNVKLIPVAPMVTILPNVYHYYNATASPCNSLFGIDITLTQGPVSENKDDDVSYDEMILMEFGGVYEESNQKKIKEFNEGNVITFDELTSGKFKPDAISQLTKEVPDVKIPNSSLRVRLWVKANAEASKLDDEFLMKGLNKSFMRRVLDKFDPRKYMSSSWESYLGRLISSHTIYLQSGNNLYAVKDKELLKQIRTGIDQSQNEIIVKDASIYQIYNVKDGAELTPVDYTTVNDTDVTNPITLYIDEPMINRAVENVSPSIKPADIKRISNYKR